ncbi:hypothetical protein [Kordia sp.]|uniref:hypothetical protein n=1 Tax=Kordia sp. TaxID=1965332 RepID=UPI003D2AF406
MKKRRLEKLQVKKQTIATINPYQINGGADSSILTLTIPKTILESVNYCHEKTYDCEVVA